MILSYALLIPLVGLFCTGIAAAFTREKRLSLLAANCTFLAMSLVSAALGFSQAASFTAFGMIRVYPFSMLFVALFSALMILVNMLSYSGSTEYEKLALLLSLSFIAAVLVSTAATTIVLLLALELIVVSASFMILIEGKHAVESAMKLFILGSISIAVLAFAIVSAIPFDPSFALARVVQSPIADASLIMLSVALFIVSFGFDTALFPFNLWIPDVYEGAPAHVTSLLAGINKKVAFVAMMEVLVFLFIAYAHTFGPVLEIISILTMLFGNIVALAQTRVKRMLAYSSISQAGYILVGIATSTQAGISASIFYIIAHSFMIIGAFAIVLALEANNIRKIEDYSGLRSRNLFVACSLSILMLSMAGMPPLMGFIGKFLLFSSAISSGLISLAVAGILNSFISIYYYAKVINAMFSGKVQKKLRIKAGIAAVILVCVIVVVIVGIYPQPIISAASAASKALFG